jgi:iron-sulfur cluster assembly protein
MAPIVETASPEGVVVTPAALKFMKRMVRFGGAGARAGFRLEVSPGGCSGMSSTFAVDREPQGDDQVIALPDGIQLFLSPKASQLLAGVTIDFVETATESRFAFVDPKAGSCACTSKGSAPIHLR